jgi:peroxiredoxin
VKRSGLLMKLPLLLFLIFIVTPVMAAMPSIGSPAPDFTLRSNSGINLKLSEHRGEVIMINFWATWCGPCRQEMPELDRLYQKYRKTGFLLLGVSVDDKPEAARAMAQQLKVSFPVLFDDRKQASRLYDVDAMPSTLLVDRHGVVRFVHRGYRAGVEKQYEEKLRELLRQ